MKINRFPSNQWQSIQTFKYNPSQDFKVQSIPTRYCKGCGIQVIPCAINEDGSVNEHMEFELQHSIHWKCYLKEEAKVKAETDIVITQKFEELKKREDAEREQSVKKAEDEMDRMIKEIEARGHNT